MPVDSRDAVKSSHYPKNIIDFIAKPLSIEEIAEIARKYGKEQSQPNGLW